MDLGISREQLVATGMDEGVAASMVDRLAELDDSVEAPSVWSAISRALLTPDVPFAVHTLLYDAVYRDWDESFMPRPAWIPSVAETSSTNISITCADLGYDDYVALWNWSVREREAFWADTISRLRIPFKKVPSAAADLSRGPEEPEWLPGAAMNAADACFTANRDAIAVVYQAEGDAHYQVTYGQLDDYTNRVANSLRAMGVGAGDAVAIAMPMTLEAVAAYIAIVKLGGVVVSIADSFAPDEIATRLRIARSNTVVTSDVVLRGGKTLPMYQKVVDAGAAAAIVVPAGPKLAVKLRDSDAEWKNFVSDDTRFDSIARGPRDTSNVLFSSGTTGEPKAIPWSHTTPIKCAMDGFYHHDIRPGEVVAWPTNIGWMMGPWLIYASLVNRATIALYYGAPNTRGFCEFVQDAGVNMLGVVPSLVKAWRSAGHIDGLDWSAIRCFSSTGEASNPDDYFWLMSRARYKPIVEYCGGTEIGGGYISQALTQPACPSCFSTPSLGLDFRILDEDAQRCRNGELFIVPPSIGLSLDLLNRDHHETYYAGTPKGPGGELLRRHGDQMEALAGGYFRIHGRTDDTMNLGGIKVSSGDIERVSNSVEGIIETAAIAVEPAGGGPSRLVVYAVLEGDADVDPAQLKTSVQKAISADLNPLFRVHDVVVVDALPRTASNKVMRRVLRDEYDG